MMSVTLQRPLEPVSMLSSIDHAKSLAHRHLGPVLLSCTERLLISPDPLAFLAASAAALGGGVLWQQPREDVTFAGAGAALNLGANGPGRFGELSNAIRGVSARLVRDDERIPFPIIGGFAFGEGSEASPIWQGFGDARMVVPRVLLQIEGNEPIVRATHLVDPSASTSEIAREMRDTFDRARRWATTPFSETADPGSITMQSVPTKSSWESTVATAVALIRQQMLDKVVLAREERIYADAPISPIAVLSRLRSLDSEATLFAMQARGDWFLGATPERLVRLQDGRVDVTCLAGSIAVGRNPEDQAALADRLLRSGKDREEHEIVVRSTMSALAEICEGVTREPGTPRVVAARSVQHLETPIRGCLSAAGDVLDLVERLHPTPAVGGYPRKPALNAIRELEEIDRGWYAGPFGWTALDGSGEFAVAIRSGLVSGRTASIFAGSGIVADSIPAAEFEETCLKMRPMLAALGGS